MRWIQITKIFLKCFEIKSNISFGFIEKINDTVFNKCSYIISFEKFKTQNPTEVDIIILIKSLLKESALNFSYFANQSPNEQFDCPFSILWVSDLFIKSRIKRRRMSLIVFPKKEFFISL